MVALVVLVLAGGGLVAVRNVRGLRNNNPGNIKRTSIVWDGEVAQDKVTDTEYEQFTDIRYGVRAIAKVLLSYSHRGLNTIELIVMEYSSTDVDSYIDNVSTWTGFTPYEALDMTDTRTRRLMVHAIMRQELGTGPYLTVPDASIEAGLALV